MGYILGLDLGTNSIGWACIDRGRDKIKDMDARIFPEGVNRSNQGKEISKNEARRLARQSRRQYARKRQRKDKLITILRANGMFPANEETKTTFFELNPYLLRKKGLDEKLDHVEFGRALFHLNQRRGFKSNRKSGKKKEEGKVKEATSALEKEIHEHNCRTLGEYLAGLNPHESRFRKRYTSRKMYEDEFDLLWNKQRQYYPELLTDEFKKEIRDRTIFFQRPLKSVAGLIGPCSLEPAKKRCRKDSFEFQQYRIFEQINRLTFTDEDGVVNSFARQIEEGFTEEMKDKRDKLIGLLESRKELKFDAVKKQLGLPKKTEFNLERSEKKLLGNRMETEYAKIFGKEWSEFPPERKEKVHQVVTRADDPEWLMDYALKKWSLPPEKAERLAYKTAFEAGCGHLSKKAIRKLLPYMKEGLSLSDARIKAGYGTIEDRQSIEEIFDNLTNPIVKQTLYEVVKLVKAIEQTYGKPDLIRVELARELKSSAKKRGELHFDNLKRKKENEEVREKLSEMNIRPTYDALLRYKLREECKRVCPYTGDQISLDALFSEAPGFQVEHIIPWPRSLDDSYMNKTLCRVDENNDVKGNKTPYEAYNGTPQYDKILKRIKILPYPKRKKFVQKTISEDFVARQLNDTAYISRMVKTLLKTLGYRTGVTKGQATAKLRYLWGLNSLLYGNPAAHDLKNRDDCRHHAIDAAVVAMTDERALHKLSAYNKYGRDPSLKVFPQPWRKFREAMEPFIKKMLVSHRTGRHARGLLHKETYYGETGLKDKKGDPLFTVRKGLEELTPKMVGNIADDVVKGVIKDHLRSLGVDPDAKNFSIPKGAFKNQEIYMKSTKGVKVRIKKVRILVPSSKMVPLPNREKTWVEPGKNHHIVIYSYQDEQGRARQGGEICTLFEAARRRKDREPVVNRNPGEGKKFLFSLAINDMVLAGPEALGLDLEKTDRGELSRILYRVQKISDQIILRHHTVGVLKDEEGNEHGVLRYTPSSFRGMKVRLDRIGRIFKAND